jgi:hypothetical protein
MGYRKASRLSDDKARAALTALTAWRRRWSSIVQRAIYAWRKTIGEELPGENGARLGT